MTELSTQTVRALEVTGKTPRKRRRRPTSAFWLALPLIIIAVLVFVLPLLGVLPGSEQNLSATRLPPAFVEGGSWAHPLGTDKLGRDVLTQMVEAGSLTLTIGVVGAIVAIGPGTLMGVLAGYYRGWVDRIISVLIDAQLALPFILIALAIISATGGGMLVLFVVLAITGWAPVARVTRSATMSIRERQFILGLRAAGASQPRIIFRHIVPNLAGTVVALATLQVGIAILIESALSFLGLGVKPPAISWGSMLATGQSELTQSWWIAVFPGLAITLVVLLVNLLGDALLTDYDPRKRQR